MSIELLVGKTIATAAITGIEGHSDTPYLDLTFTDGTEARIEAYYDNYSRNAQDEYTRRIRVELKNLTVVIDG